MELEELAQRLATLEEQGAAQAQEAESRAFIDKYGTKFSGDEGIGLAILAELNRRGISSAEAGADRVVTEILDGLRQEMTMVLDKIRNDGEQVSALMDQVQDIQSSVEAATGTATGAEPGNGVVDVPPQPPSEPMPAPAADQLPPEQPAGDEEQTPAEIPLQPAAQPEAEQPPAEEPANSTQQVPPAGIPSDTRVKRKFTLKSPKVQSAAPTATKATKAPKHLLDVIGRESL